jgi:hypothetical protein
MTEAGSLDVSERYQMLLDLFAAGEEIMRQNLRRTFPTATPEEIEHHLLVWLHERPGAEHGDAVGRPGTWPRRR